jgi:hypothetical protein
VPDILRNRSLDWFAHNFFRPRKCAAAMSCDVSASSLQPLSRQSAGTVHEFYDMDEMPISQWFLEFIAERSLRSRSRAMTRAPMSSRRVVATCRDAAGASGYTFH